MSDAQDLSQRRSRLTPAQRALLERRLRVGPAEAVTAGAAEDESGRIAPRGDAERGAPAPLSFGERRLWHFARGAGASAAYNVYHAVGLRGPLDVPALARAVRAVAERHEALWSRFVRGADGEVAAHLDRSLLPAALPVVDLGGLPPTAEAWSEGMRAMAELTLPAFDLERGPLLRVALLRLGAEEHVLLIAVHHVAIDGWSLSLIVRDLAAVYGGAEPPPAPLQAADFAVWQRRRIAAGALAADLAWWRQSLAGAPPAGLALPARRGAPGGRGSHLVGEEVAQGLKALALGERATLFVAMLTGLAAVLHAHSGETDVVIGTPVALRGRPESSGIVAFLLNLLPVRTDLAGDPTFAELLRRVRDAFLDAFSHRGAPFEWVAGELLPGVDPGATPWIRVLFNMPSGEAGHGEPLRARGVEVAPLLTGEVGSEFDLTFYAREVPGGIRLDLGFDADLLAPGEPARLLERYAALLGEAVADPGRRLSELAGGVAAAVGSEA